MAKRTYNRRGRQTAKTPVARNEAVKSVQRIKAAQTCTVMHWSKDKMTVVVVTRNIQRWTSWCTRSLHLLCKVLAAVAGSLDAGGPKTS